MILIKDAVHVELVDYKDLNVAYHDALILEKEKIYGDSAIEGKGWEKTNKDGGRDFRFADNREYPKVCYGLLSFESATGLKELYLVSSKNKAEQFADALNNYKTLLSSLV